MATAREVLTESLGYLGIYFLAVSGAESTALTETIIQAAYRKLRVKNSDNPLTTNETNDGIEVMTDMINEWKYDGIDLGVTTFSAGTSCALPTWSLSAVKSNLAVRISSEFDEDITQGLATEASDSFAKMSARTDNTLLDRGLSVMNDMMLEWAVLDIHLGYQNPASLDDDIGVPDWSLSAVKSTVALRMATFAERSATLELAQIQEDAYNTMLNQLNTGILTVYPSTMPIGAGNEMCGTRNRFFGDPTLNDLTDGKSVLSDDEGGFIGNGEAAQGDY